MYIRTAGRISYMPPIEMDTRRVAADFRLKPLAPVERCACVADVAALIAAPPGNHL